VNRFCHIEQPPADHFGELNAMRATTDAPSLSGVRQMAESMRDLKEIWFSGRTQNVVGTLVHSISARPGRKVEQPLAAAFNVGILIHAAASATLMHR